MLKREQTRKGRSSRENHHVLFSLPWQGCPCSCLASQPAAGAGWAPGVGRHKPFHLFQHSQHHQHPGEGPFASCSQGFQQVPCVCWVPIIPTAHLPAVGHKHLESCCPLCHHANRVKAVCTQAGIREGALSRMNILFLHITSCSPKQGSPQGCKS